MCALDADVVREGGPLKQVVNVARVLIEASNRPQRFITAEFGGADRTLQNRDGLVVHLERHGKGMPVFAAMSQRKARRIAKSIGRAMEDFGDEGHGRDRAGADSREQQQFGEVLWAPIRRGGKRRMQSLQINVRGADIMARRHFQMWLFADGRRRGLSVKQVQGAGLNGATALENVEERVRALLHQLEARTAVLAGLLIGQVNDCAHVAALDRRMRRIEEACDAI
jgi:hypothetical protein